MRFDKTDERYRLLERLPRIVDGQFVFRKKARQCRFILCVLDLDDDVVSVLYKINEKSTDDLGNMCARVTFTHCVKK